MRFRRAFLGFAFCLASGAVAAAQDPRQVEVGYEITYAGLAGFRIDVTARFSGNAYDVETNTFKNGVLRAVTMTYMGRNRAWGGLSAQGAQPTGGSLSIVVDDKTRTWAAQYGAGGTMSERHTPDFKPAPQQTIPDSDRTGSLDPLSAGLTAGLAGDAACDRTLKTNDGKRRIDVILRKVRTESAAASGVPGVQGDVLVCAITTRRVSGEFYDAPKEAESERERPAYLWLARLDSTPFRYPVKLESERSIGTVRGRMLWFRERPLSPQEGAAMQK